MEDGVKKKNRTNRTPDETAKEVDWMMWLHHEESMTMPERFVLIALHEEEQKYPGREPSVGRLAQLSHHKKAIVQECLESLKKKGYVEI